MLADEKGIYHIGEELYIYTYLFARHYNFNFKGGVGPPLQHANFFLITGNNVLTCYEKIVPKEKVYT